jgi:hypothetical protein
MKIRGTVVGTPIKPEKVLVKSENLTEEEKAIARANIGIMPTMIVAYDNENKKASHTSAEIFAHVQAGGTVMFDFQIDGSPSELVTLADVTEYYAHFTYADVQLFDDIIATCQLVDIRVDENGNVSVGAMSLMDQTGMENFIYEQLGPIDEALSSILKIQNELIGGDGV